MRTLEPRFVAVKPFATVTPACLPLRDNSVSGNSVSGSSVSTVPSFVSSDLAFSWPAATAAVLTAVTARPQGRVEATGVGYAAPAGADKRRGVDGIGRDVPSGMATGTRLSGTNGKQQDQLHLMSRRDPRTWRPPA